MTTDFINAPESALQDVGLHEQITAIGDNTAGTGSETDAPGGFYAVDKLQAHLDNIRHLAVSIFVFSGDKLLIQRRAATKYHSAGLWANTVCSHPRWNESVSDCAQRRLNEELGWKVPLTPFGSINYAAQVGELFENEHVHCLFGKHNVENDVSSFNRLEVDAVAWLSIPQILNKIQNHPEIFTEWFKIYMTEHRDMIEALV